MVFYLSSKTCRQQVLGVIGGCLCLSAAYAGGEEVVTVPVTLFPTTPGVSLYGLGGNGWTATGDVMAPIVGRPLNFTYIDPQIYYHNNPDDYTASAGLGQRWLTDRFGILGAYVFGDYNHLNNGNSFWFVSPGVERLGQVVDVSLNGYIPVSNQRRNNDIVFADQLGNFNNITFSGHTQYDTLVQTFDSTGWGFDGEIGIHLPWRGSKIYLGGYYFSPKDNSTVGGGAVRAEVPINRYLSAVVSEAYDNEFHNTLKGGVTLWFGGRQTGYQWNGDLAARIVDPIQRNLVATAGGAHTAQPVLSGTEDAGTAVELTNISFFVPAGSLPPISDMLANAVVPGAVGDGTYENPYRGMTQYNVNDGNAQNNRIFYINSGTYQAQYDATVNPDFIVLNNDALFGRTNGFRQEAVGGSRPLITFTQSGFQAPPGDTSDSFNDLQLAGSGSGAGIFINHDLTGDTSIPDMNANINGLAISQFGDGVDVLNGDSFGANPGIGNARVSMTNSVIENNTGIGGAVVLSDFIGASGGIAGVNFGNQLNLNVNRVTIANNTLDSTDLIAVAGGIGVVNEVAARSLFLNVDHSVITQNATPTCGNLYCDNIYTASGGIAAVNSAYLYAHASNLMTINVSNSQISNQTILKSLAATTGGIAVDDDGGSVTLNVNSSQIVNNVGSSSFAAAGGIAAANETVSDNPLVVNVTNSNISENNASSGSSYGAIGGIAIYNEVGSVATLNVSNSVIANNIGIGSSGNTTGGIAGTNWGDFFIMNVTGSTITGNIGEGGQVGGGIAVYGYNIPSSIQLTVTGSTISNNEGINNTAGGGGIAIYDISITPSALTLVVSNSTLSNNQGTGVFARAPNGNLSAIIDRSSVFDNTVGLNMDGPGTIAVTNPVYFDGIVNFSGGGVITFPNVTPSNGDHVVCPLNTGICHIEP